MGVIKKKKKFIENLKKKKSFGIGKKSYTCEVFCHAKLEYGTVYKVYKLKGIKVNNEKVHSKNCAQPSRPLCFFICKWNIYNTH